MEKIKNKKPNKQSNFQMMVWITQLKMQVQKYFGIFITIF